jgi:hypothetical protein
MRALAMNRRYREAAELGDELGRQLADTGDPILEVIRAHIMIRAVSYYGSAGDFESAAVSFRAAEADYVEQYPAWLEPYRRGLNKRGLLP